MTRSASPNGAVEFSYDFPVAGPSTTKVYTPRRPRPASPSSSAASSSSQTRTRSPVRPRWEASPSSFDEDAEDDTPYDSFGYPYPRHAQTLPIPVPAPTRNQWLTPTSSPYPYSESSAYAYAYGAYGYEPPMLMAPQPSSCESAVSALSAASASSHHAQKEKRCAGFPAKIRKPRRSVDSERPASPTWDAYDAPAYVDSPHSSFDDEPELDLDDDASLAEPEPASAPHHASPSLTLRRHWTALSLRVRFGVFRAKRRMRARVMSL
ncbi:hypothetical protein C8F04DRAFT_1111447 [Mycena alexandri]|uniref:Uncharacterized protein n=1 Tax=Mycena alexandri TaxID=1745969 RepID=A0AAD6SQ19_9AGAR|nr:hypothetical protein C8F04DRAFT_1111447 [Mycena alexandri]